MDILVVLPVEILLLIMLKLMDDKRSQWAFFAATINRVIWPKSLFCGIRIVSLPKYKGDDPTKSLARTPYLSDEEIFDDVLMSDCIENVVSVHYSKNKYLDSYEAGIAQRRLEMSGDYFEVKDICDAANENFSIGYYYSLKYVIENISMMTVEEYNTFLSQ